MSLLTGMNDILKNEAAMEAADDMILFEEELALEADEFLDVMIDGEDEEDDIDLMEEEDEEDDNLNEGLDDDDNTEEAYELTTEAAALTGQSFLQSLLLNNDPITTKDGSVGSQDSAANCKDNYSNAFDDADDPIKTENGSVGEKTTTANHKENFSAEFSNDTDNIKTEDGSVGPKTSSPNPAIESALFFGDVMGEEVAVEGLIKNFKEKKNAKRAELLNKMGVTDIDSEKFDELRKQGKFDQAIKLVANFGKKLEDGLKKLEDKSDINAARKIIKINAALLLGLQIDKNAAEYSKSGMSEKDARKKAKDEMKNKVKKIEDPAQESYITECLDLVCAFEASIGQNDSLADHSDNYSDGEIDDSDPVTTEDGEDIGDDNSVANPANESDIDEELRLLNESLLGDIEDTHNGEFDY